MKMTILDDKQKDLVDALREKKPTEVVKPLLEEFIDFGGDINKIHPDTGFTMLHGTLLDENYSFAKELLALGADPNIKNMNGDSALMLVMSALFIDEECNHRRDDQKWKQQKNLLWILALMMLDNGGDLHSTNSEGKTPFDYLQDDVEKTFLLAYTSLSTRLANLERRVDQISPHVFIQDM